jgi:NADH-quinone oxidoreductase subunit A
MSISSQCGISHPPKSSRGRSGPLSKIVELFTCTIKDRVVEYGELQQGRKKMLSEFGFLGLFLIFAIFIPASMLLIPMALSLVRIKPQNPNPIKQSTYESGMETFGRTWVRFNFRYYFFALLFVLFDLLTIFLYPWAVRVKDLDWVGLVAVLVFVGILAVGLAFAWRKRALEWS